MWFFVENSIPVSKLGWETRHTVKFGLFWGPLFTWDFSNIGSIVKKFCAPDKIRPSLQSWTTFLFDQLEGWNFHSWLYYICTLHRVNRKKNLSSEQNPSRQAFFMKEAEKNPSETIYRCDFLWGIRIRCRNWAEKPGTWSNFGFLGDHFSLEIFPS